MRRINVQVSGPKQADFTYKTVVLKGNASFKDQIETADGPTKFVIRWDFDLNDEVVTVPENCILEFDGGSLKNGTIIGQDTVFINVGDVTIWGENLDRAGTWIEHSGADGKSAYECYLETVPSGQEPMTEEEWLDSLKGEDGEVGETGRQGDKGNPGTVDYSNIYTKTEVDNITSNLIDNISDDIAEAAEQMLQESSQNTERVLDDYYDKDEVDSLISNTPETDVVVVDIWSTVAEELTPASTEAAYFDDSGTITPSADYTIKKYSLEDLYNLHFSGSLPSGVEYPFVAWFDENDDFLYAGPFQGSSSEAVSYTKEPLTAPVNAAYLYLNVHNQTAIGSVFGNDVNVPIDIPSALDILVPSGTDPETGKDVRSNKLYRVPGPFMTSYSEWSWKAVNEKWVMMANPDYGMDDEPKETSGNAFSSKGAAKYLGMTETDGKFFLTDNFGAVIAMLDSSQVFRLFHDAKMRNLEVDDIKKGDETVVTDTDIDVVEKDGSVALLGKYGEIILGIDKNGDFFGKVRKIKSVYELNIHKDTELHGASGWLAGKSDIRTQLLMSSDTHENIAAFDRFIEAGHDFETIKGMVHLGDLINYYTADGVYDNMQHFSDMIRKSSKPVYYVCGNHDAGTYTSRKAISVCASDKQLYNWFIKPAVDNGWLKAGEYFENKMYYSHDFGNKTMLIVLYPYDDGNVIDESLWTKITYSPSYPDIEEKQYSAGEIVNIPNFTEYSFRANDDIDTRGGNETNYPQYKALRYYSWYSKTQLEWFCERLAYASEHNYTVLVAQHYPFSNNMNLNRSYGFSIDDNRHLENRRFRYNEQDRDIICDIIEACRTKTNISRYIELAYETDSNGDNTTSISPINLVYNGFSSLTNDWNGLFLICGHFHWGGIWEHDTYDQTQLITDCGKDDNIEPVGKTVTIGNPAFDRLNVITFPVEDNGVSGVHLARLGADYTGRIMNGKLLVRDNEIVSFNK